MNSEHIVSKGQLFASTRLFWVFLAVLSGIVAIPEFALSCVSAGTARTVAQTVAASPEKDFSATVAALAAASPDDSATIEKLEKKAFAFLDSVVLGDLDGHDRPDLDSINAQLLKLASREESSGENYQVLSIGGKPNAYALTADFGFGAPSAIRLYSEQGNNAHFVLAGEIDRFSFKDMLDDSLQLLLVPVAPPAAESVFVTVGGRMDELRTGEFSAWRFDGKELKRLWSSDLVSHSTYKVSLGGFALTYCKDPDDQDAKACRRMVRETYSYSSPDGQWRQVSSEPVVGPAR